MERLDKRKLAGLLANQQGLSMNSGGLGLAPYGLRYEESVYAPVAAKGKGYFGPLSHAGGSVSTEISAHDDSSRGFPLLVPGLSSQELTSLLSGADPSDDIYRKASAFAAARMSAGADPFAQPNELRIPVDYMSSVGQSGGGK